MFYSFDKETGSKNCLVVLFCALDSNVALLEVNKLEVGRRRDYLELGSLYVNILIVHFDGNAVNGVSAVSWDKLSGGAQSPGFVLCNI